MAFPSIAQFAANVSFPVRRLANAQKLSLSINTEVGTEVMVTDWEAAGLAGPHQRLNVPSTAQGAVFVSGGTQDGVYTTNGSNDGKDNFSMLGNGDNSVTWFTDLSNVGGPALSGFAITGGAGLIYYSLSDVATPDLAANWKNASDDSPASITVTNVTQGELDAGITVTGATGISAVNKVYVGSTQYLGRLAWRSTDGNYWIFWDDDGNEIQFNNTGSFSPGGGQQYFDDAALGTAFGDFIAWKYSQPRSWLNVPDGSAHENLTLNRNDVASEQNWEVI